MRSHVKYLGCALAAFASAFAKDANITLAAAATGFEADNTAFYYGTSPLLFANDGSAADGGFRAFVVGKNIPWASESHQKTGRSKVVAPVYGIGGRDFLLNIPAPDSILRVFEIQKNGLNEIKEARRKFLGDWSTICTWRSTKSGESYGFLFGKKQVVQFLIRGGKKKVELLEVRPLAQYPIS